jgi:hypothetical protein
MLCRIISHKDCQDILLDIGMYATVLTILIEKGPSDTTRSITIAG